MKFDGENGWDTSATLLDGSWVERRPRRPEVEAQLLRETRLLPWLAPRLPLPVPIPAVVGESPLVLRHTLVPGEPIDAYTAENGAALGRFLRALHATPPGEALALGLPAAEHTHRERDYAIARCRAEVLALLPDSLIAPALELFDAILAAPADTVVHADLGPDHVLAVAGRISGVIDFGDAHLGDPAADFGWALSDTAPEFADAVAETYGVTPEVRARARRWHQLGPWYEVLRGHDTDDAAMAAAGLAGVIERLAEGPA
ncbi:aminoglycoside phosphotransferase [Nocardia yunnanensis]|uniref:Aminoglycoside phosphotransferase n=1 Tax=Nocardia yunnanensis TaxID=2382165 RepID=A0A386ZA77_9NOCA|nr:phosphotransferase [Nocardia yunnanensis]AYF74014.1 aminoglycoside phosphotransferase [Nocardia yunnanensis]